MHYVSTNPSNPRCERRQRRRPPLRPEYERYFERFSDVLRRLRAPGYRVADLQEKFSQLPARAARMPCPYCLAHDRGSLMATLAFTGKHHGLQCEECHCTVMVETGV